MSIRIIKRFKIFLSPPPQNAHESTRIQFSLLISASKLGTQYVHVPRRHIIWFSLDLFISPDSLEKLLILRFSLTSLETVRWCKFLSNAVKAPDTKVFQQCSKLAFVDRVFIKSTYYDIITKGERPSCFRRLQIECKIIPFSCCTSQSP